MIQERVGFFTRSRDIVKGALFRQLLWMYGTERNDWWSDPIRMQYRASILSNMVQNMKILVNFVDRQGWKFVAPNEEHADVVRNLDVCALINMEHVWNGSLAKAIRHLWKDPAVKQAFSHHQGDMQLTETAEFFFNEMKRVRERDYIPTCEDVMKCHIKTTGIVHRQIEYEGKSFHITDTGGQVSHSHGQP